MQGRAYVGKKYIRHEINDVPTAYLQLEPTDPRDRYPLKQWMDYLTKKQRNKHIVSTTGKKKV